MEQPIKETDIQSTEEVKNNKELNEQLSKLQADYDFLRKAYDDELGKNTELIERLEKYEENDIDDEEATRLRNSIAKLSADNVEKEQRIAALNQRIGELMLESKNRTQTIEQLNDVIASKSAAFSQADNIIAEVDSVRTENSELITKVRELSKQITKLNEENQRLTNELKQRDEEIEANIESTNVVSKVINRFKKLKVAKNS